MSKTPRQMGPDAAIGDGHESPGNAERIVECVNACTGIKDPSVVPELVQAIREIIARVSTDAGEAGWMPLSHDGTLALLRETMARLEGEPAAPKPEEPDHYCPDHAERCGDVWICKACNTVIRTTDY